MASVLKRGPLLVVSALSVFFFLIVLRLRNEMNFLKLMSCFGRTGSGCVPASDALRHPPTYHSGYINIGTHEPLRLDCDVCAVVSNSGQVLGQKTGPEIDRATCVWRMNNAPTKGFSEDVGERTTVRVVSHTSVPLLLRNPEYFFKETNGTVYVVWGPFRNMRDDGKGIVYNMLKKTLQNYRDAKVYVTSETRMHYCDDVFKKETGRDRVQSGSYLSTGWFTLILAMEACERIRVYGMINDTYCRTGGFRRVPYHYYEPGRDECDEYLLHENAAHGGHRFITEKRVFAKWAKLHNITFTHPDWAA